MDASGDHLGPMTRTIPPIRVLCDEEELRIPEIGDRSTVVLPRILAEAERCGLKPAGPWIYVSYGRDGRFSTRFRHAFCLPVEEGTVYDGPLELRELQEFPCAWTRYMGDFTDDGLGGLGYRPLVGSILGAGLRPSGESREIYHQWVRPDSMDNVVEIQIGIG